jgi:hypothetical protein
MSNCLGFSIWRFEFGTRRGGACARPIHPTHEAEMHFATTVWHEAEASHYITSVDPCFRGDNITSRAAGG